MAPYEVHLPPDVWYDYWTGQRVDRKTALAARDLEIRDAQRQAMPPLMVSPGSGDLPLYVHAGTILPMAPLVQSTDERPVGPLLLRVFPGDNCRGALYQDDGNTYNFSHGAYFRQEFTCEQSPDGGLAINLQAREGRYSPWWNQITIEAVGLDPATVTAKSARLTLKTTKTILGTSVTVPYTRRAQSISFRKMP